MQWHYTKQGRQSGPVVELPEEDRSAEQAELPKDWQENTGVHGERLLVPNLKTRRLKALVVTIITGVVLTGLGLLVCKRLREPNLWVITLMLTMFSLWLVRQTLGLLLGRNEWRIDRGRLVYQRRFAGEVKELCQAQVLELTESRDNHNASWYHLYAIELLPSAFERAGKTPRKVHITHSIHDPTKPRCLARWLSREAGIPFYDRIPTEAEKKAETEHLLEQLANTSKYGRFAAGMIVRARGNKSGD